MKSRRPPATSPILLFANRVYRSATVQFPVTARNYATAARPPNLVSCRPGLPPAGRAFSKKNGEEGNAQVLSVHCFIAISLGALARPLLPRSVAAGYWQVPRKAGGQE